MAAAAALADKLLAGLAGALPEEAAAGFLEEDASLVAMDKILGPRRLIQSLPAFDCMKTVNKSVLIWYSAAEMFALVTDVARYPEFLPWCNQTQVLTETAEGMTAKIGISFAGLRQSFTTRNVHEKDQRVSLTLVNGPFSSLEGDWKFLPLGDGSERACKIDFTLSYDFDNGTLAALVGPVFDKIAGSLVDAFVKRASQIYGES